MAVTHTTSPFVTIYKISGDIFTKLANPTTLPTGNGTCCDFSNDGNYLAVGHYTTPYVTIYKRAGDVFTKLANPAIVPNGTTRGVSFSPGSNQLAVASSYMQVYSISGDVFTRAIYYTDRSSLSHFSFSPDSTYLARGGDDTPFIDVFRTVAKDVVSKVTHFQTNPLAWLPNNDNIGIAKEAGSVGSTVKINLFPKLNTL